ncbi:MAG: hypothetical protein IKW70_01375 [Verrucomicrobia bacterium]|nr:hypothetical protein [Verrucomicrobiota bacterium]
MISRRGFLAGTAAAMAAWPVQKTVSAPAETPAQDQGKREKTIFRVLGSCASEGCPSPFCTCDVCVEARTRGGKDMRTRAGYQLGDTIRIDWSPDAFAQGIRFNLDPCLLRHIFITHSHEDHLLPMDFWTRGIVMKHDGSLVKVYGNENVLKIIEKSIERGWQNKNNRLEPVTMVPGKTVEIPEHQISVTALLANHMKTEQALLYIFAGPGWKLFIAHDTDYFPDSTWELLRGQQIDVMVVDSTWGMVRRNDGHLGIPNVVEIVERMKKEGGLKENALVIPSHLSHHGTPKHAELEANLAPLGMEPAYDGKIVEL